MKDLAKSGWRWSGRGKGSHRVFVHDKLKYIVVLSGNEEMTQNITKKET